MKSLRPIFLLPFLILSSCAAPLVLAGMGAAVGIWTYDDFTKDRGEMIVRAPAEQAFAVAQATIKARPAATDIRVVPGSMRIEFKENKAEVVVQILLMPDTPEFSTLRVYAAELGIRGRGELARAVAEDIGARFQ